MKKSILILILLTGVFLITNAQPKHTFAISGGEFMYDGKPIKIYSGEMHYSRIPHEYWKPGWILLPNWEATPIVVA